MPRRIIKKYMPDHKKIRDHKYLRMFGNLLHDPGLWHLNRHSVAGAFFVGLIAAYVPIPFQMVLAAGMAIALHVNLPISVVLVWVSNPLTMPPMFYLAYKVGAWVMAIPEQEFSFELSFRWFTEGMAAIWQPFLLGCLILGLSLGLLGYASINLLWRGYVLWKRKHKLHLQGNRK